MDQIANDGIAAHWAYKEGKAISKKDARHFHWLKQLVQSLQELNELEDPGEFLEAVGGELREADIYALTPNGEVKELPIGSTPLDFAYSIHTEVGDHCAGAKVNDRIVPLKHTLQSGDILGWSWLLPPYKWVYDARAIELTRLISLDAQCLRGKYESDHTLARELFSRFIPVMARRLAASRRRMVEQILAGS